MKKITKKLFFDMLSNDCILRDYISTKNEKSQDEKAQYLYFTYKECVIKVTIYEGTSIWWDCYGYIYWLRAGRWQDLMEDVMKVIKND